MAQSVANPVPVVKALMRAASRDSLRATVFLCIAPFVVALCISGCATRRAVCAAVLVAAGLDRGLDLLTKVRTRLIRDRLVTVRLGSRSRFSADLW